MKRLFTFALLSSIAFGQSSVLGGKATAGSKVGTGAAWTANNYTTSFDGFWVSGNLITNDQQAACWLPSQAAVVSGNLVLTDAYSAGGQTCYSLPSATSPTKNYLAAVLYRPKAFTYGTFEVKMQLAGAESNSSFWLLNAGCTPDPLPNFASNPLCGYGGFNVPGYEEIDVVENGYQGAGNVGQNAYGNSYSQPITTSVPDATTTSHVYTVVWNSTSIVFKIDGSVTATLSTTQFSNPMYMWLDADVNSSSSPVSGHYPTSATVWYVKHWNLSGTLDCSYVPGGPSFC